MRLPVPSLLASCLALACLAAPAALAQSVMTPGAMPPPPSASEPRPRAETAKERPTRPARRAKKTAEDAPLRTPPASAGSSYRERIDTRPGGGALELEDDPRTVRPVMQNGRPGMGMRF